MGPDDLRRNALGQLAAQLAQRDAFHQLRTQQQLGYLVHMSSWTTLSVRSLVCLLEPDHNAEGPIVLLGTAVGTSRPGDQGACSDGRAGSGWSDPWTHLSHSVCPVSHAKLLPGPLC
jgi:hypothetical protein